MADEGRYEVTTAETDKYNFRVQTFRNITDTAPYFHNGSITSLDEAVRVMAKTQLNTTLKDNENNEVDDIVTFMESLTGEYSSLTMPRLPATSGSNVLTK